MEELWPSCAILRLVVLLPRFVILSDCSLWFIMAGVLLLYEVFSSSPLSFILFLWLSGSRLESMLFSCLLVISISYCMFNCWCPWCLTTWLPLCLMLGDFCIIGDLVASRGDVAFPPLCTFCLLSISSSESNTLFKLSGAWLLALYASLTASFYDPRQYWLWILL